MDPEIAALAGAAGTALVSSLATEAWQRAIDGFSTLWRRAQPERAEAIDAELATTHDDIVAAQAGADTNTQAELSTEWQGRIRRLLVAQPQAVHELRTLLAELAPEAPSAPAVTQHATASGQARIFQAGRDQNFTQS